MHQRLSFTVFGVLLAFTSALARADVSAIASPQAPGLSACQLEHPQRLNVVTAECGVLTVPEDPANSTGRWISIAFTIALRFVGLE